MDLVESRRYELKKCEKGIEEILQFFIATKLIKPDLAPITQLVKSCPEKVRTNVIDFKITAIIDSRFEKLEKEAVRLMMLVLPGTGKAYLISQVSD